MAVKELPPRKDIMVINNPFGKHLYIYVLTLFPWLCFAKRPTISSKNLFVLNNWFIVGKTAVDCRRQCKYYVTLTQKAFVLLLINKDM